MEILIFVLIFIVISVIRQMGGQSRNQQQRGSQEQKRPFAPRSPKRPVEPLSWEDYPLPPEVEEERYPGKELPDPWELKEHPAERTTETRERETKERKDGLEYPARPPKRRETAKKNVSQGRQGPSLSLQKHRVVEGIIWSEILSPPRARKPFLRQ